MSTSHYLFVKTKDRREVLATAIWTSLVVVAVVVVSRKLAGAFSQELPASAVCLLTTLATALSLAAHFLFQSVRRTASRQRPFSVVVVTGVVTLIPPFALGIALLPAHSIVATSYLAALFLFVCAALVVA